MFIHYTLSSRAAQCHNQELNNSHTDIESEPKGVWGDKRGLGVSSSTRFFVQLKQAWDKSKFLRACLFDLASESFRANRLPAEVENSGVCGYLQLLWHAPTPLSLAPLGGVVLLLAAARQVKPAFPSPPLSASGPPRRRPTRIG